MINNAITQTMNCDFRLDVLVMREPVGKGQCWVAQCLQYDIVAQADTINALQATFLNALEANIILGLRRGVEPLSNLKPAPKYYWDQYSSAKKVGPNFPVSLAGDRIPKQFANKLSRIPRGEATMKLAGTV
jgi:hypothetical protein